jgi:hypothetical protein
MPAEHPSGVGHNSSYNRFWKLADFWGLGQAFGYPGYAAVSAVGIKLAGNYRFSWCHFSTSALAFCVVGRYDSCRPADWPYCNFSYRKNNWHPEKNSPL